DALFAYDMTDVVAVNHDGRDRHAASLADLYRIERFDKRRSTALLEGLCQLDHQLAPPLNGRRGIDQTQPRRAAVAPPSRIVPHVGRTAEAGQTPQRDGGGIRIGVHLQRRTDEQVDSILTGQLAQHPVGAQATVMAYEENIGPGAHILLHSDFTAEA